MLSISVNFLDKITLRRLPDRVNSQPTTITTMWVSRRTDYATRALLALALDGGGPMKLEELARRTGAPQSVLEQVMPVMRSAGIVRSERGPAGGYRMNKAPEEITLERVVRLFEGQLAPIGYATRRNPDEAPKFVADSLREAWSEVRDATIDILESTTFADLAKRAGGRWRDESAELVP
jgi:Rrf2 family protein